MRRIGPRSRRHAAAGWPDVAQLTQGAFELGLTRALAIDRTEAAGDVASRGGLSVLI
jgi:hypothetical protein